MAVGISTAATARADAIRQAEWPLDSRHYQADKVWRLSQGQGITVAVVDSGVDAQHPDLTGQVLPGASFLGDTHDDGRTDTSSDSHGTAISGIIAGTGKANGGTGMTGLAPKAKILPIRIAVDTTVEPTALAEGIKYAADHHAQVINISLGTPTPDPLLRQAVTYALDKGAILVASAGNNGQNGNPPLYPAAFPGVIDVTGVTDTGAFWPVSESGPQTTLAAPASNIYSTNDHGQYVNAEGTSYAAAYVSAAAALIRSAHPNLTAGQTIRRLITTAHRAHGQQAHTDQYGYGTLDPLAALNASASTDGDPTNPLLTAHPLGHTTAHKNRSWAWITLATGTAAAVVIGAVMAMLRRRKRQMPLNKSSQSRAEDASKKTPARPKGSAAKTQKNTRQTATRTQKESTKPQQKRSTSKPARP